MDEVWQLLKNNVLSNIEDQWIGEYFYVVLKGLTSQQIALAQRNIMPW